MSPLLLTLLAVSLGWILARARRGRRLHIEGTETHEGATRPRHARERARRALQIRRKTLRRENGLGVTITPRPARRISGYRASRRRATRLLWKRVRKGQLGVA